MADLSSHPDFDLDVALSADLDGEADAYATELGVAPADLRAVLTTPAAAARRAELGAVRTALAADADRADGLDEVTRRRLLAGAGSAAGPRRDRPRRYRSWMLRAGAAAAVTVVMIGALYALTHDSGQSGEKSTAGRGGAARAEAVRGDLGDLGTIDAAGVGRLLRGRDARRAASSAPEAAPATDGALSTAGRGSRNDAGADTRQFVAPQAVATCADQYATDGTIRFRASGDYEGSPAVVLGIDTDRRTIVFVVAADNCTRVLYSASR